jgi:glutamine cyclotransferase
MFACYNLLFICDTCTDAVLNGIAWNDKEKVLYLTGKLWPRLYKIKLLADVTDDDDKKKKGKNDD